MDEFDFSELRNYLQGQIDLGDAELFLDEPWALTRGKTRAAPARPVPPPVRPAPVPHSAPMSMDDGISGMFDDSGLFGSPAGETPFKTAAPAAPAQQARESAVASSLSTPAPRPVRKTIAAYETADSLEAFYGCLKTDVLYAQSPELPRYAGPQKPKLLFLLPAQLAGESCENFLQSAVGEMLVRLFGSLNIDASGIGVTYFFKGAPRAISPLLETSLRKMLTKELSFIQPEVMVTFGEPLFHQIFGKAKSFNDLAGSDLDFAGTKTVSLVDPYAMSQDKQLKWLTWKVHIPRSSQFEKPQS